MAKKSWLEYVNLIAASAVFLVLGLVVGYSIGLYDGFKIAIQIGLHYVDLEKLGIAVSNDQLIADLWKYKQHILN